MSTSTVDDLDRRSSAHSLQPTRTAARFFVVLAGWFQSHSRQDWNNQVIEMLRKGYLMEINAVEITRVETDHVLCRVMVTLEFSLTRANSKKAAELGELAQAMEPVNVSINRPSQED